MQDDDYLRHCLTLLDEFTEAFGLRATHLPEGDPLRALAARFEELQDSDDYYRLGPPLVQRLFATYPQLAPLFPRQVLWFLGGDCLHLMADDEIAAFQQLDDLRHAAAARGETMNLQEERAKLLKLQ
ncbi:MAG: PA2817 family protein [Pseudomonadota bacterium]